jgi:hypothetical protein
LGSFRSLERLGNGRLLISLAHEDGTTYYLRDLSSSMAQAAHLASIPEGTWIGMFNIRRTKSVRAFEEGPLTMIYSTAATTDADFHDP